MIQLILILPIGYVMLNILAALLLVYPTYRANKEERENAECSKLNDR